MFTWVNFILTCIDFVPMILFSLVLFRQRLKPYWKQISLAALAGTIVTLFDSWPLLYVIIICVLLRVVWKFSVVPSLLIALSGYILSVIVSTAVLISCEMTEFISYADFGSDSKIANVTLMLILMAKCSVLYLIIKLRLGFTFLSNYTRIPFTPANVGFYLFIAVVIIGITNRHSYADNVLSALMPIQMLSMATVLFLCVMLGKELGFQR
ncbi:hypothetical protein HQN90_21675 [Paenibacillus alba]|uniref:hypothetical protein n=1 Tax=Paenibacillus alba TaxID=1197127 RepID=UPI0015630518|nr:hypothetical protein [Paenibacillus alba]NQX68739.1 hypothetical protein [Paenibacillus alba]